MRREESGKEQHNPRQINYLTTNPPSNIDYRSEIIRMKEVKNAVILAHYYQEPAIQDLADYVGDSLGLSQQAAETDADIIVFAGVHFMAETAKILNPEKKVLLPDRNASCSLAESCPPDQFRAFVEAHPDHTVISYVNCSAEVKAMSDLICTSSNAQKILDTIPLDQPVIFAPDKNLGKFLMRKTGRDLLLWDGACTVHEAFAIEKIQAIQAHYPDARLIAHPESEAHILDIAHFIGSTAGMIQFVKSDDAHTYIVATEMGIIHQMQKEAPAKKLIPAPARENNTCACSECEFMKMNTMEKLYLCLLNEDPEITLNEDIRKAAQIPLDRMLEISSKQYHAQI